MTGGVRDVPREWVLEVFVGQDGWLPSTFNAASDGSLTGAITCGRVALDEGPELYRMRDPKTYRVVIL